MSFSLIIIIVLSVIVVGLVIAWIITAGKTKAAYREEIIRKEARIHTVEALMENERSNHQKALEDLQATQEKAIEAAKTALALENEKTLKAREEALKKEAEETMKVITGGLDRNIKDMKEAFEAQKKSHAEESSSIKTQFAETVKHIREQADTIGSKAESLASAKAACIVGSPPLRVTPPSSPKKGLSRTSVSASR